MEKVKHLLLGLNYKEVTDIRKAIANQKCSFITCLKRVGGKALIIFISDLTICFQLGESYLNMLLLNCPVASNLGIKMVT